MKLLLFMLLCGAVVAKKRYDGHRMVLAFPETADQLHVLNEMAMDMNFEELDFWTPPSRVRPTAIRVSPNDFGRFRDSLAEAGISYNVTVENLQLGIDQEEESMMKASRTARNTCDFFNTYCTLAEVFDVITFFESEYPTRVHIDSIGTSIQGRPIWRVKIAENIDNNNDPKPAIYLEMATHAREWITVSGALYMIKTLAEAVRPEATFMLSEFDWYIIPVHNPDGYHYAHTTERYWRKNRRQCNRFTFGVDLNRNYNASFGGLGTSSNCVSDIYKGTAPFSEPETAAIRDAIMNTTDVFAFFAVHSYGEMIIIPFAYDYDVYPARYPELSFVAQSMADEIYKVNRPNDASGPVYLVGTAPNLLGPAAGGSDDYFYFLNVPYSYTYELSPAQGTYDGFVLPTSQIPWVIEDLFMSLWKFVDLRLDWPSQPNETFP